MFSQWFLDIFNTQTQNEYNCQFTSMIPEIRFICQLHTNFKVQSACLHCL